MPNIKSAKKRVKIIETKTLQNRATKKAYKEAIKEFLREYKGKKNYAIMAFVKEKDYESFIKEVGSFFEELIFVQFKNEYRPPESTEKLLECAKKYEYPAVAFDSIKEAYNYLLNKENIDLALVTGSLYLAADFRDMLTKE